MTRGRRKKSEYSMVPMGGEFALALSKKQKEEVLALDESQFTDGFLKADVNRLVSRDEFEKLPWFRNQLSDDEKELTIQEGRGFAHDLQTHGRSKISAAAHLYKLQVTLAPKNCFNKFLRLFHYKVRTAQRDVAGFRNLLEADLPTAVISAAAALNMPLMGESKDSPFGKYTPQVRKHLDKLKKVKDVEGARQVLNVIEIEHKQARLAPPSDKKQPEGEIVKEYDNPQESIRAFLRFFDSLFQKLPPDSRTRNTYLHNAVGGMLTLAGAKGPKQFVPVSVPDDARARGRGRPALSEEEKEARKEAREQLVEATA